MLLLELRDRLGGEGDGVGVAALGAPQLRDLNPSVRSGDGVTSLREQLERLLVLALGLRQVSAVELDVSEVFVTSADRVRIVGLLGDLERLAISLFGLTQASLRSVGVGDGVEAVRLVRPVPDVPADRERLLMEPGGAREVAFLESGDFRGH